MGNSTDFWLTSQDYIELGKGFALFRNLFLDKTYQKLRSNEGIAKNEISSLPHM